MDLGDLFRQARIRRGRTLEDLASETKISVGRLAAFERNGLPPGAGFYQRAQARAYARALDVERVVMEQLDSESRAAAAPAPQPQPELQDIHDTRFHLSSVAVACVVVILAFAGYIFFTRGEAPANAVKSVGSPRPAVAAVSTDSAQAPEHVSLSPSGAAPSGLGSIGTTEQGTPLPSAPVVAPTDTPAVAAVTQLVIASIPQGARVTVDGVGWGATPVTIRHLPAGPKRIRLTSDGYAAAERVIDVRPDRPSTVSVELQPLPPSPAS